jgi:serine kinase of HPr protein (carbohydrate metabolism regulator)
MPGTDPESAAGVQILHAGLVTRRKAGQWCGALITGPSGSGKSDLALRLCAAGWRLVSDDRTIVWRDRHALFGRAPASLAGLMELRGQGVFTAPIWPGQARIVLLVECASAGQALERMPEKVTQSLLGQDLPNLRIQAGEASACARLDHVFTLA